MTRQRRQFHAETAVRDRMPIMVGFTGPSGSGKSLSLIRFGTGICSVMDGPLVIIDADSGRSKQYAPLPGQKPNPPETFEFQRIQLDAPYGSLDYADAIEYAVHDLKAAVVGVDPACREHYGPGGYLSLRDQERARLRANNKKEQGGTAYVLPSAYRKEMFERISAIGTKAALLFAYRAVPKLNWNTSAGKGPEEKGLVPNTTSLFVWDMICNVWLPYCANGVPCWEPTRPGEKELVKGAPVWAREIFDGQITENTGRRVALWALGDAQEELRRQELAKKHDDEHKRLLDEIRSILHDRGFSMRTDPDALASEILRCFACDMDRLPHLENDEMRAGLERLRTPPSETVEPEIPDIEIDSLVAQFGKANSEDAYRSLERIYLTIADRLTEDQRTRAVAAMSASLPRLGIDPGESV